MKSETEYRFCTLCDRWILLGPHKQNSDPVTSSSSYIVTEETSRGSIAHVILSGKRLASKKYHDPPPDLQPESEVILVHPKAPEPEVNTLPVPDEALDTLSQPPPTPEMRWKPDESSFYEVKIIRHNYVGSTGRLSNSERVFIHNHVAKNTDYPVGSSLWVRLRPAGPDAMYDYRALELWREPDSSKALLGDIYATE
jgi:hypothetical protein